MKKKKPEPAPTLGESTTPKTYVTKTAIAVRGTDEWREWTKSLADHVGERDVNELIARALNELAKRNDYPASPMRLAPKSGRAGS